MTDFCNALVFLIFLAITVFGAARLGWAAVSSWYQRESARLDRLVDDAIGKRQ